MSNLPEVSIIMPNFNTVKFLPEAIKSVFAQTFTNWELIVIDDGSTDSSWEYLQKIDDPRVRVFRNNQNIGAARTINRAIDLAKGKWIGRMDSDDIMLPERIEKQLIALKNNPEVDLLGCGAYLADIDMNLITTNRPPADHASIVKFPSMFYPLLFGGLLGKADWWRKWRMDENQGIAGYEFDLYFRSHLGSVFSNVSEPVYVYRFVGHTRSWSKMTKSVYYKAKCLIKNGFRMGLPFTTISGLLSLAPRPIVYAIKLAVGSKTAVLKTEGTSTCSPEEREYIKEELRKISMIAIPLKNS
jgi:glycosyltransferase involved in cell wall biosynthesis